MLRELAGWRERKRCGPRERCSSQEDVAELTAQAIAEERFLVLPHPEVHEYALRKASDIERWLAGMRRLNRRFASSTVVGRADTVTAT